MPLKLQAAQMQAITDFCVRHQVQELALFGSATRNDFSPDSDVDVLVDFLPGATPSLFGFVDMQEELGSLLGDRRVDLVMKPGLSKYLADRVLAQRVVLFER
jgi:predicted nucleotidyltransferase